MAGLACLWSSSLALCSGLVSSDLRCRKRYILATSVNGSLVWLFFLNEGKRQKNRGFLRLDRHISTIRILYNGRLGRKGLVFAQVVLYSDNSTSKTKTQS